MRKIWVCVILALWLLAGAQIVKSNENGGSGKIMEVLGQVGTMEQTAVVEYYGVLDERVEDGEAFLSRVLEGLRERVSALEEEVVLEEGEFLRIEEEEGDTVAFVGKNPSVIRELKLVTRDGEEGEGQYLIADFRIQGEPETAFSVREWLKETAGEFMRAQRSSVNVIGSYSGKLTLEERNQAADELLKKMDARVVSEHREMEVYTVYGYTPYIPEYQLQEGAAVNVNIAMYYDEGEEKTYVYAAVPVIGLEY